MRGKSCPADVRHPLGARAVVAVAARVMAGCSLVGTGLAPSALRAPAQLTSSPPSSVVVVVAVSARAREVSRPAPAPLPNAPLLPVRPCNLVDWEGREEQKCSQEGRGGSDGFLELPLHMHLLQG